MDMFETAMAMEGTLKLCGITQEELGKRMGVSQSYIANKLRLLGFSEKMRARIRESGISERHARSLLRLECEEKQAELLEKITERGLSVRECEALVDAEVDATAPALIERAADLDRIRAFGMTVDRSIGTLCSHGIDARRWTSIIGNKMYITVCISDI
ncbi:MAG: hypothetical protein IJX38_06285 [Clostridia bacterium]|nr:hypothetical protein [Clostridia bacterium]